MQIAHGSLVTSLFPDHVYEMIEQVLFTMPGERVMYPDFGVGLERLIFDQASAEIAAASQMLVSSALKEWLGDVISVRDVRVTTSDSTITVDVVYELLATRELRRDSFTR
jgi:phage baseplate assembly protein W